MPSRARKAKAISSFGPVPLLSLTELGALVRTVLDFPQPEIQFRDFTPLIADPRGFASAVEHMATLVAGDDIGAVAGIDARGFIFGAALAQRLGAGFVPVRKAGKLPVPVLSAEYALEYGTATLELDPTVITQGAHVLLIDDLIATGGTALAALGLLRDAGAVVKRAMFVIDLFDLGGSAALRRQGIDTASLIQFPGH